MPHPFVAVPLMARWLATVLLTVSMSVAAHAQGTESATGLIEDEVRDTIMGVIDALSESNASLDELDRKLQEAIDGANVDAALGEVDRTIAQLNGLTERLSENSVTMTQAAQLMERIRAIRDEIRADTGLGQTFKDDLIGRLNASLERSESSVALLGELRGDIELLAEDFKASRREVAYDVIVTQIETATDALGLTAERIQQFRDTLEDYIVRLRERVPGA